MLGGLFWSLPASQPLPVGCFVWFWFSVLFLLPYLSCTVALMPAQKFFFTRRTGALLGKMSCQDAKLKN